MEEIAKTLCASIQKMQNLVDTFHDGKIFHDGLSICLVGCPNVGKSSLMNLLLDKDRAIVTPIAGTTRDVLEDHLKINCKNFELFSFKDVQRFFKRGVLLLVLVI